MFGALADVYCRTNIARAGSGVRYTMVNLRYALYVNFKKIMHCMRTVTSPSLINICRVV